MKSNYKITINMNMETLMHCLGGQNSACDAEDDEKKHGGVSLTFKKCYIST
jgi:hypothetical protein